MINNYTNKTLTALNNQMSLVREVLERYTEDEAGEEQKEKYAHMSDDEIITLLTNTLMTCSNYEDFETDLIINFDYSNY